MLYLLLCAWLLGAGVTVPIGSALAETHGASRQERSPRASFALDCGSVQSTLRVRLCTAMPGGAVRLQVEDRSEEESGPSRRPLRYELRDETGRVEDPVRTGERSWRLRAPSEPGLYPMTLHRRAGSEIVDSMRVQLAVLVPFSEVRNGYVEGYRIGRYPEEAPELEAASDRSGETAQEPFDASTLYERPDGFVRVSPENRTVRVSPRFRLEQFLCKQESGYPKFLVVQPELLIRLEQILDALAARGVHASTLHVMSGYRTPYYNASIGNVPYSRHLWGDAADLFVDGDGNGRMDDLNGDGRTDRADARWLRNLIAQLGPAPSGDRLRGGLSAYGSTSAHGPFVHVDVRGYRARW